MAFLEVDHKQDWALFYTRGLVAAHDFLPSQCILKVHRPGFKVIYKSSQSALDTDPVMNLNSSVQFHTHREPTRRLVLWLALRGSLIRIRRKQWATPCSDAHQTKPKQNALTAYQSLHAGRNWLIVAALELSQSKVDEAVLTRTLCKAVKPEFKQSPLNQREGKVKVVMWILLGWNNKK